MFPEYSSYSAEIINKPFKTEEGISYPKSVRLTFISPDGHIELTETLGYLDEKEIFGLIKQAKDLVLDNCYINALSLATYRSENNLDRKDLIEIRNFSAKRAFFDNNLPVDIAYVKFLGDDVNFEEAFFAKSSINFHAAEFEECGLNFSNVQVAVGNLDFTNISVKTGDVTFKNSCFGPGDIDFLDAVLGTGEITFVNTDFGDGDVSFVNTQFGDGDVSFKVAVFGDGKIDFHYAKFGDGDISFERTEFGNGTKDFRTVEFGNGRVNFNRSVFGQGDVSFEACQIKSGKISYKRAEFGEGKITFELGEFDDVDASFDRANFGEGSISYHNSRFKTLSLVSCHINHYLDLRVARCDFIDLSDTIARDIIDLKPYDFEIDVDRINFSGMRLIGRIYIDWKTNHVKELIYRQSDTSKLIKAEQFRTLKENFNVTGQYNDEDKAYVEFKRMESESMLEESVHNKPVSGIWMYPLHGFKLLVFDWAGQYATNPLRVIISMLVTYTFYSFLLMFLTYFTRADVVSSLGDPDKLTLLAKSFYHCAITFLTIGYGDYYPSGNIRWLSGIIGFTGLFLMSYFTVAFVRKILR